MPDGDELWELAVTMPPVTEIIHKLLVKCGHTTVVVERTPRGWAPVSGSPVTDPRPDYEGAVADARRWVRVAERKRLLANALDDVLRKHAAMVEVLAGGEDRG